MHRIISLLLSIIILSSMVLIPAQIGSAQDATRVIARFERGDGSGQVGIRPSQPDFLGEGPKAIVAAPDGRLYLLDSDNQRILIYDPASADIEIILLPENTGAFDLAVQAGSIYVLDGRRMAVLQLDQRGHIQQIYPIPDAVGALSSHLSVTPAGDVHWLLQYRNDYLLQPQTDANAVASLELSAGIYPALNPQGNLTTVSQRIDRQHGFIMVRDEQGKILQSLSVGVEQYLGSANLIAIDRNGYYYVLVEEVLENIGTILVETTVRRFANDGQLLGIARVPLENNDLLPHRFVSIGLDGDAYFLAVKPDAAEIYRLSFATNYRSRLAALGEVVKPASSVVNAQTPALPEGAKGITRDQIMQNVAAYLNVYWYLGDANYHTGPADDWTGCASPEHWRLPRYLAGRLHQTIPEVPYQYGGKQSINEFRDRINNGYWAGSICMEAVLSNAAGIDCSGLVQKSWEANQQYLPSISYTIGWSDLRRGDLMWKSEHSILFEGFINGNDIYGGAYTYESTMTSQVDRVVHWTRSWSTLSYYGPRRYNNVTEQPPTMIPAYQNIILNGSFDTNSLQNWWKWGDVDTAFYGSGILCFKRRIGGTGGSVGQTLNYYVPANSVLEITVQLGNSSAVTKYPHVFVKSGNNWDMDCHFTVPPNSPLRTYTMRGRNLSDWNDLDIEVWPDPTDSIPDVLMDNVTLTYRPDLAISGTQCIVPDTTPPNGYVILPANGATITSNATSFTASAWDNDGGTGVQMVEFHVGYNGGWHQVGTDTSAPYGMTWNIPDGTPNQVMIFTIHVIDQAGNEIMDPGGYHHVTFAIPKKIFLPVIRR